ncbi:hypothetical protein FQA47_022458 [Oryzias melastigma]|uniref:Uncharacterized protein n=1 Tax=Oryzias melastigma TaxID=30732 RepID=A0A834CQ77_ORYME|nr:hypothetical protein FQA47_022458 [Oryzias melastigma]
MPSRLIGFMTKLSGKTLSILISLVPAAYRLVESLLSSSGGGFLAAAGCVISGQRTERRVGAAASQSL